MTKRPASIIKPGAAAAGSSTTAPPPKVAPLCPNQKEALPHFETLHSFTNFDLVRDQHGECYIGWFDQEQRSMCRVPLQTTDVSVARTQIQTIDDSGVSANPDLSNDPAAALKRYARLAGKRNCAAIDAAADRLAAALAEVSMRRTRTRLYGIKKAKNQ